MLAGRVALRQCQERLLDGEVRRVTDGKDGVGAVNAATVRFDMDESAVVHRQVGESLLGDIRRETHQEVVPERLSVLVLHFARLDSGHDVSPDAADVALFELFADHRVEPRSERLDIVFGLKRK